MNCYREGQIVKAANEPGCMIKQLALFMNKFIIKIEFPIFNYQKKQSRQFYCTKKNNQNKNHTKSATNKCYQCFCHA